MRRFDRAALLLAVIVILAAGTAHSAPLYWYDTNASDDKVSEELRAFNGNALSYPYRGRRPLLWDEVATAIAVPGLPKPFQLLADGSWILFGNAPNGPPDVGAILVSPKGRIVAEALIDYPTGVDPRKEVNRRPWPPRLTIIVGQQTNAVSAVKTLQDWVNSKGFKTWSGEVVRDPQLVIRILAPNYSPVRRRR